MKRTFFNHALLESFPADVFAAKEPYPWHDFHRFLTPEGFAALHESFPSLDFFELHSGMERIHGQRPHDRYYLGYEESFYGHAPTDKGTVRRADLPDAWRLFLDELETSKRYRRFVKRLLRVSTFRVRYAWHIGTTNSEVSPHLDSDMKIGTHIFYFNTSKDWNPSWGGELLVLGGKSTAAMNPEFTDFASAEPSQAIDNHSFLFRNGEQSWHGVRALTCPEGHHRRLFNVIFEFPEARGRGASSRFEAIKRLLRRTL